MTGSVIYFSPRAELTAQENLAGFIAMARDQLSIFGDDLRFDEDSWDVTDVVRASGLGRVRIGFTKLSARGERPDPLADNFRDFAKAYIRYLQGLRPVTGQQQRLAALRVLEAALEGEHVTLTGPYHADRALSITREHYKGGAYGVAKQLQALIDFLAEQTLLAAPFQWTHTIERPSDTVRIGREHEERRAAKLPSRRALEAVAYAFRAADNPSDRITAAAAALMCSAPVRVGELLRMRVNCDVVEARRDGRAAFGLRWWAEKGVEPAIRWIVPVMEDVAREALDVIKRLTTEARQIARWYEKRRGELYLPPEHEFLRHRGFVSLQAADELLGLRAITWAERNLVPRQRSDEGLGFRFSDFQSAVLATLPEGFPLVETGTALRFSDALFVVRANEFRTARGTSRCMIEPVTQRQISDGLGGRVEHWTASLFSRLGLADEDGTPLKITSHQFRHYLNTLAQGTNLDQIDIALWSGRKSVRQNRAYDHVSADELLDRVRIAVGSEANAQDLATIGGHSPISRAEYAELVVPTAHLTEYGVCVHDFAMHPCELHRDCLNCEEHVCVKGDEGRARRLEELLEGTRRELQKATAAVADAYEGADRWLTHQMRTVERLELLIGILRDPSIPSGSVVRCGSTGMKILPASSATPLASATKAN